MKALITLLVVYCLPACAATGTLQGIVHDPQHRPIPGAEVAIHSRDSTFGRTIQSDANGEFELDNIPEGSYQVTVSAPGFQTLQQVLAVNVGKSPVVHLQLEIGPLSEVIEVAGAASKLKTQTSTVQTLVTPAEITETAGADQTNSLAMITDFTPGAYMVHDMLHMRGGHQVNWFFDGIPVVNTNIAANVAPLINPKNVEELEIERGGYSSKYGDRTYGFFNVVTPSGFERDNEAELILPDGNFSSTDDQFNIGGHTQRFAYYASIDGDRSDARFGHSGFASHSRPEQRRGRISVAVIQSELARPGALDRFPARGSLPDPQLPGAAGFRHSRLGPGAGRFSRLSLGAQFLGWRAVLALALLPLQRGALCRWTTGYPVRTRRQRPVGIPRSPRGVAGSKEAA